MQNLDLTNYRNDLIKKINFTIYDSIGDITKNIFLNKLSFLENQLFNKSKNIINNYQTWLLIYLKKLFYDAVYQNYEFLQNDYKKFIMQIYNFFELDKNKNVLTSEMYKLFEESLNNNLIFENAKKFSENYYKKISWKEFLENSVKDSEFNQDYFDNCHLPWNIEILKHKNSNNEFVLNIYADDDILLNLSDLVINKILTQDIFYKITFKVNFYNSREKDFDYKKILSGDEPLINIITSKYELLISNLFKTQKANLINILNFENLFECLENNTKGFDPLVQSLLDYHYREIKNINSDNQKRKECCIFDDSYLPTKVKMIYFRKTNLNFNEFVKDTDFPIRLFIYTDKPIKNVYQFFDENLHERLGDHLENGFKRFMIFDIKNYLDKAVYMELAMELPAESESDKKFYEIDEQKVLNYSFYTQLKLLETLTDDNFEICGIYSRDLNYFDNVIIA